MRFDVMWWRLLLLAVFAYLIGNFNSAITISKLKKRDIRAVGSGNPGTMNMSRNFGLKIGLLVFLLDILKGVIPTLTAKIVFSSMASDFQGQPIVVTAEYIAMFFAVLGHVFPVFYKFKGGKGIATTIGALITCDWKWALGFGILALTFIFITKIGSMGSFIATTPTIIVSAVKLYYNFYVPALESGISIGYYIIANVIMFLIIFVTWFAHRTNIKKLLAGEEHETNWWQMIKDLILKKKIKKQEKGQ